MENRSKSGPADPGQQISGLLNFHGVVTDENNRAVEGALVVLFGRYYGGVERSLGSTLTDGAGSYLVSVPKPSDYSELLGFKLRAGLSQAGETPENGNAEDAAWKAYRNERIKSQAQHRRPHFSLSKAPGGNEPPGVKMEASNANVPPQASGHNSLSHAQETAEKGNRESAGKTKSPAQERRPHIWSGSAGPTPKPYSTRR